MKERKEDQLGWSDNWRAGIVLVFGILGVLILAEAIFVASSLPWAGSFLVSINLPGATVNDLRPVVVVLNLAASAVALLVAFLVHRKQVLGVRIGYVLLLCASIVVVAGDFSFRVVTPISFHLGLPFENSYYGMNILTAALAGHLMMKDPDLREVLADIEAPASAGPKEE
ncbi:MAG: hypothetical protein R3270_03635 [Gammaproteobacteria bacterium]|nr:hypothetical protein [Gammaproteobacteria bacterium]